MTRTHRSAPLCIPRRGASPRRTDSADHALPGLLLAGLGAQLLGVSVQAVFHLAGERVAPVLTEARTTVIDHVVSNLGVACLAWQVGRWASAGSAWATPARRLIVVGTGVEVTGAVADGVGHLASGEQPAAFAAIGLGYLLVVAGAVIASRPGPAGGSHGSRPDRAESPARDVR